MDHDGHYKAIFSLPFAARELLQYLAEAEDYPFLQTLDFSTLERVNGSFLSQGGKRREADIIWRVKSRHEWVYVYVLLEFQSRVDPFMAVRMMTYLGLLYQDIIKQKVSQQPLPPVLPVVLYNGEDTWYAPTNIAKLITPLTGNIAELIPSMRYALIDIGQLSKRIGKQRFKNLIEAIAKLEYISKLEEAPQLIKQLIDYLDGNQAEELSQPFSFWLMQRFLSARYLDPHTQYEVKGLKELNTMLAKRLDSIRLDLIQQGVMQGIEQGIQQGLIRGREEEKYNIALTLLRMQFNLEQITEITGLSAEQIAAIRDAHRSH